MLREMVPEDVGELYHLYEQPEITRYIEGLFSDMEEERAYIQSYYNTIYKFYGYGMWLITMKDGSIIGRAGIENNSDGVFEMGYMLGLQYQHQGYALEACEGILKYAEENLEIERKDIICRIDKENTASVKLAGKLGIIIEFIS